jgi:hypothetical protein
MLRREHIKEAFALPAPQQSQNVAPAKSMHGHAMR